jgi:antitoxin (DNA-binding transcriptional repressor) of toxin-antitoxin stability system
MDFVSERDFRNSLAQIWERLPQEQEMVVTRDDKPVALLTPLSGPLFEESIKAVRSARAAMATKLIQQHSIRNGTSEMTLDEINAEIDAARQAKQ